jgi:hypothetical protein
MAQRDRVALVLLPLACREGSLYWQYQCTTVPVHEIMTTRKWSSGTIKFSRKKQGNTRHSGWLAESGGEENKEGNLENLFLQAQWPSILYSTKSTEIKVKQENEASLFHSILFPAIKDWLLSL